MTKSGRVFDARKASTEDAFEQVLNSTLAQCERPSLIEVHQASDDALPALRRLTEYVKDQVLITLWQDVLWRYLW